MSRLLLLLTPTGVLPSPRWRWWARVTAATPAALLLVVTLAPKPDGRLVQAVDNPPDLHGLHGVVLAATQAASAVTNIAFVVAAVSLVVRYRRARGLERQQLRWVALATVVLALLSVVILAAVALDAFALAALAGSLCVAILPLAIGAAILRYRLYDLDRIISRTLAYGLLTLLLVAATPRSCWGWASWLAGTPAWWWPGPPWWWPRCSSRPATASRPRSTGASTAAATTPPARSRRLVPGCASRSTWTP